MKRASAKAALKKVQKTSVLFLLVSGMGRLFCFWTRLSLYIFNLNYQYNKILFLLNEHKLQ